MVCQPRGHDHAENTGWRFSSSAIRRQALAGGISEALLTTAAGLCVAIPALTMHRYFMRRIDVIVVELEQQVGVVANEIADFISARSDSHAINFLVEMYGIMPGQRM